MTARRLSPRDVTVVIRSAGERTVDACRALLAREVPAENIVTVSNAPFSATLADCYRVGIERQRAWTWCIDADVLVATGALNRLLDVASRADTNVCEIQGLVLDKLMGIRRPAGNHLYRTSLLPLALSLIPTEGRDMRPEFFTLNRMAERGYSWVEIPVTIGLHDFEQYDRDLFRKCCVHARKFDTHMPLLVAFWRTRAHEDHDYRVALWGMAAGIAEHGEVRVDIRRDYGFSRWISSDWTEKPALPADDITPATVDRILATWITPGGELDRYAAACARQEIHGPATALSPTPMPAHRRTWLRSLPSSMGRVLAHAGRRLERFGTRAHQHA